MSDRAEAFRSALASSKELSPGELVLVEEACRLIDQLDQFHRVLAGEPGAWASIDTGDVQSTLVVSAVVAERRQHVAELRQVVKHLDSARSGAVKDRGASGIVDQLSARRRERTA